ncbi:MAG: cytochrome c maturation protein CcmE [Candidatus Poribacteria bacterium]|nr:cytochrome c maturation protein CcmE [Candidatus Poribacteria bacterium]
MERKWIKFVLAGTLLTAAAVVLSVVAFNSPGANLIRFTPDQLLADQDGASAGVQVDGWVAEGTEQYDIDRQELRFQVRDAERTAYIDVVYREGLKPDSFKEGQGVVVSGHYNRASNTIEASKLMTKCPSKYEAADGGYAESEGAADGGYAESEGAAKQVEEPLSSESSP